MAEVKRSSRVYFGVSDSTAKDETKTVTIWNPVAAELGEGETTPQLDLQVGDYLITKFTNGNEAENFTLELALKDNNQDISVTANTGFPALIRSDVGEYYKWPAQELVGFVWVNGSMPAVQDTNETVPSETTTTTGSEETTEPTVNEDTTETAEPVQTLEPYYWKPFTFRVASEDVYGVTKLVNDASALEGENEERPVGYKLILQAIQDALTNLNLTVDSGTSDWSNGQIIALRNGDNQLSSITLQKPTYNFDEIQNMGDTAHFWNSIENNYVNNSGLSIGRRYESDNQGNYTFIDDFTPYVLTGDTSSHNFIKIGRGELAAHQAGTRDASGNLVTITPYTRIFGDEVQLAMDNNSTGKVSIGTARIAGNNDNYNALYTFRTNRVDFGNRLYVPGITITYDENNPQTLTEFVDSRIGEPIGFGTIESVALTYPKEAYAPAKAGIAKAEGKYALVHRNSNTGGNLWMWLTRHNNYKPFIIGWNVNEYPSGAGSADDFYVWECWLGTRDDGNNTDRPCINFGLRNTSTTEKKCRFKVYIMYVKNSWCQNFGNLKVT